MSVIVVDRREREFLGRRASRQVLIGVAACESSGVVVVSEGSASSQAVEAMGVCVWCWRRGVIGRWGRPIQTERAGAIVSRTSSRRGSSRKARAGRHSDAAGTAGVKRGSPRCVERRRLCRWRAGLSSSPALPALPALCDYAATAPVTAA